MYKFIKRNILSLLTIVSAIIVGIYEVVFGDFSVYEGIVLTLLILNCTTQIVENRVVYEDLEEKMDLILKSIPKDSINKYNSLSECLRALKKIYPKISVSVEFASLDYKNRTKQSHGRELIYNLKDKFAVNNKIKYRYLFYPTKDRVLRAINSIIKSNLNEDDSYFSYVDIKPKISFASFIIIDSIYLIIRSPYDTGERCKYLLIKQDDICKLFYDWFDMLWKEATIINCTNDILELINTIDFTKQEKKKIKEELQNARID